MKRSNFENILGFPVTTLEREECINQICKWIESDAKGHYLVCSNPHSLEIAHTDRLFRAAIREADIVVPDGVGILIASKILGGRISRRITGSDIFRELSSILNQKGGHRYFFLGSTEKNLARLQDKMQKDFPNIEIAGIYSPPFKSEFSPDENSAMVEIIKHAKPDVLWVGMTAPKQEKWIYQHKNKININFIGAVGAVFDFYAGTVKRSNYWFLEHGLEWLPRLMQEPRRLWNRMFVSAPLFLIRVLMQRLSKQV